MIASDNTDQSIATAAQGVKDKGAITSAIYSTSEDVIETASYAFAEAGVCLSCNLLGNIFVNQSAAFSDFHATGANPAGNACLTDTAFVANRFRVIGIRREVK
jgi:hypothetical protein